MAFCQRQQLRDIFNRVLAVGIHLHRMGKARARRFFQPTDHRRAFTRVFSQTDKRDLRLFGGKAFQLQTCSFIAAVIHNQARQAEGGKTR
ncbi:hypothetical protein D3C78_800040 [compost metagenome]